MKRLLLLASLILMASCEQAPYPEGGALTVEGREEQIPIPQPHALVVDDVIEFVENRGKITKITASVDEPGEALVIAEGLPEGATFELDEEQEVPGLKTYVLQWTPGQHDANDKNNPTVKVKDYPVVFEVSSSVDPDRDKRRFEVILRVNDNPQGIEINTEDMILVKEGETLKSEIKITDRDFPNGPFNVEIDGVPEDVQLVMTAPNKYDIVYSPNHFVVKLPEEDKPNVTESRVTFDGVVTVTNPRGGRSTINAPINVDDVRLTPVIIPPESVTQGLDVSLQVVSHDLNEEIAPQISLVDGANPSFGTFSQELVEDPSTFSSVLNVKWTNIPPKFSGKEHTLTFKTCVKRTVNYDNLCKEGTSQIKIVLRDRKPPRIYRSAWKVEELVYVGFDEILERSISIVDQEDNRLVPEVRIEPKNMAKYVSWKNGKIRVQMDRPGRYQFNLIAESAYNVSSSESFIFEVFPKNRKRVLFFADSTRDPEALFYKSQFDAQMMNPAIQTITKRDISDRDTLIVTTSTLIDLENRAAIGWAINKIPNIVVASPLIQNLPERFINDLRTKYDLDIIGRYSSITETPLEKMFFVKTKEFVDSKNPIGLKGKASRESRDPMIFNAGLYDQDKICKSVLGISPDQNNPYVIGATCNRLTKVNGKVGRFVLLGTEWADLQTTREDMDIPSKWFQTMLKGKF